MERTKKQKTELLGSVVIVIIVIVLGVVFMRMNGSSTHTNGTTMNNEVTTASGLVYTITKPGSGAIAKAGDKVQVHYTGTLADGTVFDSSVTRGAPFEFNLGAGQVIAGWDEGVAGMEIGEKRTLVIPANLAYGDNGVPGAIPPGATLTFEVELLAIL